MKCRFCGTEIEETFVDLGNAPASNSFLSEKQLLEPEVYYPLKVQVCHNCWLVQVDEYKDSADIFNGDYAYFSSFSSSWLIHAQNYSSMIIERLHLTEKSFVVEIASNDGYLLRNFVQRGIPCLGIEPSENTAEEAKKLGVESWNEFFNEKCAEKIVRKRGNADLIIGNNVLAHVPDINGFVKGLSLLLADSGTITLEFPHLLNLIKFNQFDTIYHEHFSYLSLLAVEKIFRFYGLNVYDVEKINTHGGSLRIYAGKASNAQRIVSDTVENLRNEEKKFGLDSVEVYRNFQCQVESIRLNFLSFLIEQKMNGKKIAAYGAAAKGNTLLNYCGVKSGVIDFVADASPHKQGLFLPGSHIPVVGKEIISEEKPDFLILFPWNIKSEIEEELAYTQKWGAQIVTCIPELQVC